MSDIGATSPARGHVTHRACRIGATSFVNVTAGAAVRTGGAAPTAAAAHTPTPKIRRRISCSSGNGHFTLICLHAVGRPPARDADARHRRSRAPAARAGADQHLHPPQYAARI